MRCFMAKGGSVFVREGKPGMIEDLLKAETARSTNHTEGLIPAE